MTPGERFIVALGISAWRERMRLRYERGLARNEGTVVRAWSNADRTLVVRWDCGNDEVPVADFHHGPLGSVSVAPARVYPDLACPATRGAALSVLRELWQDATIHLRPDPEEGVLLWCVERWDSGSETCEWLREDGTWGTGDAAVIRDREDRTLARAAEAWRRAHSEVA